MKNPLERKLEMLTQRAKTLLLRLSLHWQTNVHVLGAILQLKTQCNVGYTLLFGINCKGKIQGG